MKPKVFVIGNGKSQAWLNYMWLELIEKKEVIYLPEIFDVAKGPLKRLWYHLAHSGRFGRFFNKTNKEKWYRIIDFSRYANREDELYFIFYFSLGVSSDLEYLAFLKNMYPKSHFILICTVSLKNYKSAFSNRKYTLEDVFDFYEYVEVWDKNDAEEMHVNEYRRHFCLDLQVKPKQKSELLFIGYCKDRLQKLLELYDFYSSNGVKCLFLLSGVKKEDRVKREGIIYKKWIKYEDVVKYVAGCECVLEVIVGGMRSSSLRVEESMAFRKKILSNNPYITEDAFFDNQSMKTIEMNDKDIVFIKNNNVGENPRRNALRASQKLEHIMQTILKRNE